MGIQGTGTQMCLFSSFQYWYKTGGTFVAFVTGEQIGDGSRHDRDQSRLLNIGRHGL